MGARGDLLHQVPLLLRVDGTDGDTFDVLGEQLADHAGLVLDAVRRHGDLDVDVDLRIGGRVAGAFFGDLPEIGDAIGDISDGRLGVIAAAFAARGDEQ